MKAFVPGFGNSRQRQEAFSEHYKWETTACQVEENLWLVALKKTVSALFGEKKPCYQFSIMWALAKEEETMLMTRFLCDE